MSKHHPRCRIVPLPDHQVAIEIDGTERLRWHSGPQYPRPFFYPLTGPSGNPLTRMGHPGAPNHDHHRSIWFAHDKVLGISFWNEQSPARIRHKEWLVYEDGDEEAVLAVRLGWYDGHDPKELIEQELIVAVRPLPTTQSDAAPELAVDLQSTFLPRAASLEFGKSNFGFLAVRVAKGISAFFGGGHLTNSEGATGEPAIHERRAAWMDYSGPSGIANGDEVIEGITYFDHPANPGHPTHWHVRDDGWMGAAVCFAGPVTTTTKAPLGLRYRLHAHAGPVDPARAAEVARDFAARPGYRIGPRSTHRQYTLERVSG